MPVICLLFAIGAAQAQSDPHRYEFSVGEDTLGTAVDALVKQTGVNVLYPFELAPTSGMNPIKGQYTLVEAIEILFRNTNFSGGLTESGVMVISQGQSAKAQGKGKIMRKSRMSLLGSVVGIFASLAGVSSTTVKAQEGAALEEIVVTGIRGSLQQSIAVKRNSTSIVDAISAEGLGRFPDENVAESLQRITGVQINRNRGEGQSVNIRGLPANFTLVQFNGRTLASALANADSVPTRSFDFTSLPSEFVRSLEVHKTSTADIEEGGLSGTVNVKTRRAFDTGEFSLAGSIQGAGEGNSGKAAPRASILYSDVFADDKIGISLGVAYTKRQPETHTNNGGYTNRTETLGLQSSGGPLDFNGNGTIDDITVRVPGGLFLNIFEETRERISALGSVEFRSSDNLDLFVEAFYTRLDVESERFENLHRPNNAQGIDPTGTTTLQNIDGVLYATVFDGIGVDIRGGSRFEDRSGDLFNISTGGTYRNGLWTASVELSASVAEQNGNNLNLANLARGSILLDATQNPDAVAVVYEDGFDQGVLDPNNFQVASLNGEFQKEKNDDLYDFRFDVTRETGWNGIQAIKFGGKLSKRDQFGSNGRLVVGGAALDALVGGLPEGPGGPGTFSAAPFMQLIEPGNGRFLGTLGGFDTFPQMWLGSDTRAFLAQYTEDELIAAGNFTNNPSGIIDVEEEVYSGYVMAEFGDDNGVFAGNIGLRVVQTKQLSIGNAPDTSQITTEPEAGDVTTIPPGEDVSIARSYTNFLPSANLKINASDDVVVRFAASRTMSRPALTQISPSVSAGTSSITQQNPLLDPFLANNFDTGVEWYFSNDGLVSMTAFYKDIVSLVRNDTSVEDLPIIVLLSDGSSSVETREFTIGQPVNGEGVNVKGFEVSYQQTLDFLPIEGFGVLGNYTFIDNSDPEQLTAASKHNFNISGYYETKRVGARLSYTWRDSFLTNPETAAVDGSIAQSFGILDGNITVNLNNKLSLVFEAINLLDTANVTRTVSGLPSSYIDTGRRFLFGARAKF